LRYIFLLFICMTFLVGKGTVIASKIVDGTTLSLVEVNAMALPNNNSDGQSDGTLSLFFYKLDGTTGLSKQIFKKIPNLHNKKVLIYYIEKDDEQDKHTYHIFFDVSKISFSPKTMNKSSFDKNLLVNEEIEVGQDGHLVRDMLDNGTIYLFLFFFFLTLNSFFDNSRIDVLLNHRVKMFLQVLLIVIFLVGGEKIIRTEHSTCYNTPYLTIGTIDYFLDEPYVRFVDCYGHKSKSKRENPEWLSKGKWESVPIYYAHDSRDYYSYEDINIYRVYGSKEAYDKGRDTPVRFYFGLIMLFIFIYTYLEKGKKLVLPSFISSRNSDVYFYPQQRKDFSKLLRMVNKEYYKLCRSERYFLNAIVETNVQNQIIIKRFQLFKILVPGIIAFGLLWAFFRVSGVFFNPAMTSDEQVIIVAIALFGVLFLWISWNSMRARKIVIQFDKTLNTCKVLDTNKDISFDDIYGYTVTYKRVWDDDREFQTSLYELDMVIKGGEVINLYAKKDNNDKIILEEAKIIASYTNKPIYHFGLKDINKIFSVEESMKL